MKSTDKRKEGTMMKTIHILLAATLSLLVWQTSSGEGTHLAQQTSVSVEALSGPHGIMLVIDGDVLHPSTAAKTKGWVGYNIYRKANAEGEFKKLTPTPLSRVNSLSDLQKRFGTQVDLWVGMLKLKDAKELWQLFEKLDPRLSKFSVLDPALREALGLVYWDTNVQSGVNYTYEVTLVDAQGKESDWSAPTSATFGVPRFILKGPMGVTGEAGDNRVTLHWQPNPADSAAFSYSVYRALEKDGPFVKLNDRPIVVFYQVGSKKLPEATFIDSTVHNGRVYYYAVVSADYAGNESAKEPVLDFLPRDVTPPAIPQEVVALPSGLGVTITWKSVPDTDLAGYNVYRSLKPDSGFAKINDMLVPVRDSADYYEDRGVRPNVQYFYRVTAVDRSGNESIQSATGLAVFQNFRPPLPPQGVKAEGRKNGVLIQWKKNEEEDLQGYFVFRAESMNGELVQVSPLIPRDTTFFLDTDPHISPKGSYWYLVQAINYTGVVSNFSAPVVSSPAKEESPETLTSFYGYPDAIGNRLFWAPPEDNTVVAYNVYRARPSRAPTWERLTKEPVPWNYRTFTDRDAEPGVEYLYAIRSVNDRGIEGPLSHSVTLTRFVPPPLPPGNVMVTQFRDGLKISWDVTLEPRVKGYFVYRRSGREPARRLTRDPLPKSVFEFRDGTVRRGTRYFYSVSCVGEDGREGERSDEVPFYVP
jgi:fibronectin type 3 domain-containing protein